MNEPEWLQNAKKNGLKITEGPKANLTMFRPTLQHDAQRMLLVESLKSATSEHILQCMVVDYAHSRGWRVAHFRKVKVTKADGTSFWQTPVDADGAGFLDLELVRERLVKIELKFGKNTTTDEQEEWIAAYERAGVEHHVFYPQDAERIIAVLA